MCTRSTVYFIRLIERSSVNLVAGKVNRNMDDFFDSSRDDEILDLIKRTKCDREAQSILVENVGLVWSIVRRFQNGI